jgi:hypothetical protein
VSDDSPIKGGINKLMTYSFTVLAAAIMLSWAWSLLKPLVPVIVVTVAVGLAVAGVVRFFLGRERRW